MIAISFHDVRHPAAVYDFFMESEERLRKLESYTRNEKKRYFFLSLFFKEGDNDEKEILKEGKSGAKMLRFRETRSKPDVNLAFPERRKENGVVEGEKKMGKRKKSERAFYGRRK